MPEAEENKQDLVDIDTSGPGAEIEIDEPKEKVEVVNETTEQENKPVETTEETKEEKKEASDEKQDKKEELED